MPTGRHTWLDVGMGLDPYITLGLAHSKTQLPVVREFIVTP
jgi:hypothetical protein